MLTRLQRIILNRLSKYLSTEGIFLGGGTALSLKYSHRPSYDLDFFTWRVGWESFSERIFKELTGLNRIVLEPVIIVEDPSTHESVKIELHRRNEQENRLLGYEVLEGIPVLSDEDILGEKLYYARCSERDIYDVKFLLGKVKDPVDILRRKFSEPPKAILYRLKRQCPKIYELL